ncbi:MAG: hypothetical protein AB7F19_03410 [Candidatus Babeliales bacterium]
MKRFYYLMICLCGLVYTAPMFALRNPFACVHNHNAYTVQQAQAQIATKESSKSKVTNAMIDDTESEWRVIAQKDGSVIMQHQDGSIREITVSNE